MTSSVVRPQPSGIRDAQPKPNSFKGDSMNVMAQAHKMTREAFALVTPEARKQMSYAKLFRAALIDFHKMNKASKVALPVSRNMYKIMDGLVSTKRVVGMITASSVEQANIRYQANGGKVTKILIEQVSFGYPTDECHVYA